MFRQRPQSLTYLMCQPTSNREEWWHGTKHSVTFGERQSTTCTRYVRMIWCRQFALHSCFTHTKKLPLCSRIEVSPVMSGVPFESFGSSVLLKMTSRGIASSALPRRRTRPQRNRKNITHGGRLPTHRFPHFFATIVLSFSDHRRLITLGAVRMAKILR